MTALVLAHVGHWLANAVFAVPMLMLVLLFTVGGWIERRRGSHSPGESED